jgi:hypothetical protein
MGSPLPARKALGLRSLSLLVRSLLTAAPTHESETARGRPRRFRHCEERSDEAIQRSQLLDLMDWSGLDWIASLRSQ